MDNRGYWHESEQAARESNERIQRAALASNNINIEGHPARNQEVKTNGSFAMIRRQYLDLYRISRVTRYDCEPDKWLPQEYLSVNDLVEDLLKPIENGMGPLIDKSVKFDPMNLDA